MRRRAMAASLVLMAVTPVWGQFTGTIITPSFVNTNAETDTGQDRLARIATDGLGRWLVAWESSNSLSGIGADYDIVYALSVDNGLTWSNPSALNSNAATDALDDGNVVLGTDGAGTWLAVWETNDEVGGTLGLDDDLLYARSTDGGLTWSAVAPLNLNATTDSGQDTMAALATDGEGNWAVVWSSTEDLGGGIGVDRDIFIAFSIDNGASWSQPFVFNQNAATDTSDDEGPTIANDGEGVWLVAWTTEDSLGDTIGTDQDLLFSRSTDNLSSQSFPTVLNVTANSDGNQPDRDVVISADGFGNWVAVWEGVVTSGNQDIFYAFSSDDGETWSAPEVLNTALATVPGPEFSPQVTTDGDGRFITVWSSDANVDGEAGADRDLLVSLSEDGGATWSEAVLLNSNATVDTGTDDFPRIAADGSGFWGIVWMTNERFTPTAGADYDIATTGIILPDCNDNGLPDGSDIAAGNSEDCDDNGVPDECEADSDGDGRIDGCDSCPDDENKTAPGTCGCGFADEDTDGDGVVDCPDGSGGDGDGGGDGGSGGDDGGDSDPPAISCGSGGFATLSAMPLMMLGAWMGRRRWAR